MKTKKSLFYKVYFSLLAVFAILLIIFAICLNSWLADYNEGIPETVSKNFFEDNFLKLDVDSIIELSGIQPVEFETEDDLKSFIESQLTGKELSYTSISSGTDDNSKKYIVKSGDYKIATFTLAQNEKKDWYPSSLLLHLPASYEKEYRILDTSKLYLNGTEVSEKYVTERTPDISAEYLPEDVKAPEWVTYSIKGLTAEPEVKIVDRNGANPALTEENGILCEDIIYDEPEEEIVSTLLAAAKQYAKCMQNDASKASVLVYFESGTDLYNSIRTAENMFVWDHNGYAFEDEKVSEFFRYDENTVSVRISFTHIQKKYGSEDYRDITDITYFAHNVGGKYLIFARYNN